MPDFADEGSDLTELALQHALSAHRNRNDALLPKPTGECHNCESPLEKDLLVNPENGEPVLDDEGNEQYVDQRLFCEELCHQDWKRRQNAKKLR